MSDAAIPARDNAAGVKHTGAAKTARIPIKVVASDRLPKPPWIRVRAPTPDSRFHDIKRAFDPQGLLNPGKAVPTLHRCAEMGRMHVHRGQLPHPELPRF